MNCECINNLQKRLVGTEVNNKKVLKAEFISKGLIFGNSKVELITTSEMKLELEGRKNPYIQNILHNYCPFCGIKIKEA